MMPTASSPSSASQVTVAVELAKLAEKLDSQLPKSKVCPLGLTQNLTIQQFDSLTSAW